MAIKKLYSGIIQAPIHDFVTTPIGDADECEKDFLMCYEGDFDSMDGPVSVKGDQLQKIADNYNYKLKKMVDDGSFDKKKCAPLQLDHSTSATQTVGRMTGQLVVRPYINEDGKQVQALYGRGTVIGADNVERANDGRWANVSIGADFEAGTLSELTITPFPAATEAVMLSRLSAKQVASEKYNTVPFKIMKDGEEYFYKIPDFNFEDGGFSSQSEAVSEAKKKIAKFVGSDGTLLSDGKKLSRLSTSERKYRGETYWSITTSRGYVSGYDKIQCMADWMIYGEDIDEESGMVVDKDEGAAKAKAIEKASAALDRQISSKKKKLSEGGNMDKEKMKKYLMEEKKLSAEEADKKLAEATDDDNKKMSADMDEHEKKMAAEADPTKMSEGEADPTKMSAEDIGEKKKELKRCLETETDEEKKKELSSKLKKMEDAEDDKKKLAEEEDKKKAELAAQEEEEKKKLAAEGKEAQPSRMSAAKKAQFISLAKGFNTTSAKVKLATKKAHIVSRLSAFRKEGKLSPAELKGFDIEKIATLDEKSADVLFSTLSHLSKKLDTGVSGTTKAATVESVKKDFHLQRLEIETRLNMPSKREAALKQLSELNARESHAMRLAQEGNPVTQQMGYDSSYEKLSKMIDDGVSGETLKTELKRFMGDSNIIRMSESDGGAVDEKRMSAIANDIQSLHNGYKELVSLVAGELGIKSDELE